MSREEVLTAFVYGLVCKENGQESLVRGRFMPFVMGRLIFTRVDEASRLLGQIDGCEGHKDI